MGQGSTNDHTRATLRGMPDEPDQVLRLSPSRAEHPGVVIGAGKAGGRAGSPRITVRGSSPGIPCRHYSTSSTPSSAEGRATVLATLVRTSDTPTSFFLLYGARSATYANLSRPAEN